MVAAHGPKRCLPNPRTAVRVLADRDGRASDPAAAAAALQAGLSRPGVRLPRGSGEGAADPQVRRRARGGGGYAGEGAEEPSVGEGGRGGGGGGGSKGRQDKPFFAVTESPLGPSLPGSSRSRGTTAGGVEYYAATTSLPGQWWWNWGLRREHWP